MKRKWCFFIVIVFTFSINEIQAQYFVKTKIDSVPVTIDSTILTIGAYRGELVWQVSTDSTHWTDLAYAGDSLYLRIDSTAVYRGSIREENCDTIYSDTILVGEENIYPDSFYFWADSIGGVYYLPGGIKVKIPPGAIKDSLYMMVEPIDSMNSYIEYPVIIDQGRIFLGALNVSPFDAVFNEAIKIQFPVKEFNSGDKLRLSGYDPFLNVPMDYNSYFLASGKQKFIEYNTDRLVPVRAEAIVLHTQQPILKKNIAISDDDNCRSGMIKIISNQSDHASFFSPAREEPSDPGSCQTITSSNQITFVDCGNLTESDRIQEISSKCNPEMTISLKDKYLKIGTQTTVSVSIKVGDIPLGNQWVHISTSSSLSYQATTDLTNDEGVLSFTVSALSEDENAYIRCSSDATYYLQEVELSSPAGSETQNNWEMVKNCNDEGYLKIYSTKIDKWEGTLAYSQEDFCGKYSLNIGYKFTLYWDSLAYQKDLYNSTGGIYGSATISQSTITYLNPCTGVEDGDEWMEKGGFESFKTVAVEDPFWSDSKEGTLHFKAGYLGWWEDYFFYDEENRWEKMNSETYYDLVPVNNHRISFANSNHIESDIMYKFGYGWANGVYVEYSAAYAMQSHLVLNRTYSNYEDLGQ
jgi:hypothetical protein